MLKSLQAYKQIQRTTRIVFRGDIPMIDKVSAKIREEFEKNRNLDSDTEIEDAIKQAKEGEEILRKFVLQLEQQDGNTWKAIVRPDHVFEDNVMFRDDITSKEYRARNRKAQQSGEVKRCYEISEETMKIEQAMKEAAEIEESIKNTPTPS